MLKFQHYSIITPETRVNVVRDRVFYLPGIFGQSLGLRVVVRKRSIDECVL